MQQQGGCWAVSADPATAFQTTRDPLRAMWKVFIRGRTLMRCYNLQSALAASVTVLSVFIKALYTSFSFNTSKVSPWKREKDSARNWNHWIV